MSKPRKKRFKTAVERINERIQHLTEVQGNYLDAARIATDFYTIAINRARADECKAQIDNLFRKRRKLEGGRKRDEQPKLF
jgi:hypothetical protein